MLNCLVGFVIKIVVLFVEIQTCWSRPYMNMSLISRNIQIAAPDLDLNTNYDINYGISIAINFTRGIDQK